MVSREEVTNVSGELAKSLKVLHECISSMISKAELHKNSGREMEATESNVSGCYTDGVTDSD